MSHAHRILVCESERLLVELLQFQLERAGYAVEVARDGREAVHLLEQRLPAAVILGDFLPFIDGHELLRRLREDDPREDARDMPVLMLSKRGSDSDVLKALRLGASEYVSIPFSVPELLARLDRMIRQGQIQRWAKSLQRKVRTPVSIPAHLWLADDRELPCLVRDISEDGFMAQVAERLEPATWFGLALTGHGVLRAQVRWCRNGQVGAIFKHRLRIEPFTFLEAA